MKKNWFTKLIDFFKKIIKGAKKKFVIKCKCKDNCCCGKSDCVVAYDEKSDSDDSEVDNCSGNHNSKRIMSVNNNNEVIIS